MALPWWLRGGLTGGAALLKEHLKKKGKELVGEARKKAIAKLAKKQKNGKKEKKKGKKSGELDKSVPIKKLIKTADKIKEEQKRQGVGKEFIDSTVAEFKAANKAFSTLPRTLKARDRYQKAKKALSRRQASDPRTTGHSITGDVKGGSDLNIFTRDLISSDAKIAKHVKGLQKLKEIRDYLKKQKIRKYTYTDARGKAETSKDDIQQLIKKYEIDPKIAKPAKESFQRIQKKKDRFKKKDAKKKGKQGEVKPKSTMKTTKTGRYRDDVLAKRKRAGRRIISEEQYLIEQRRH
jgi:hypothetical protein